MIILCEKTILNPSMEKLTGQRMIRPLLTATGSEKDADTTKMHGYSTMMVNEMSIKLKTAYIILSDHGSRMTLLDMRAS